MPQPKKNGNYFTLPNAIFNIGLSASEIAIYAFLLRMENRKTYTCYPSYKTIGRALNMSANTVMKYVRLLEDKELITTEHTDIFTRNGMKQNGNLLYHILPIQQAIDEFYRRQLANYGTNKKR